MLDRFKWKMWYPFKWWCLDNLGSSVLCVLCVVWAFALLISFAASLEWLGL